MKVNDRERIGNGTNRERISAGPEEQKENRKMMTVLPRCSVLIPLPLDSRADATGPGPVGKTEIFSGGYTLRRTPTPTQQKSS